MNSSDFISVLAINKLHYTFRRQIMPIARFSDKLLGSFDRVSFNNLLRRLARQPTSGSLSPIMVNIWGTFCGPCIREMPILAELSQEYADKGVQIVGIVIDAVDNNGTAQQTQITAANKILTNANAKYVNIVPSYGMLGNQLRVVMAIPTTVFVNKQGEIVGTTVIGSKDKQGWVKIIESLR